MARLVVRLLLLFTVLAIIAGGIAAWGYAQFVSPGPLAASVPVVVPKGVGVARIAQVLHRQGVIADERIFRLGVRLTGLDKGLRAGEYEFPARVSAKGAAEILRTGKTVVRRLTVAEGLTTAQVLNQLKATEGLEGLMVPEPDEGRLLPETYHFAFGDSRAALVSRMQGGLDRTLSELWAGRAPGLPLETPRDALILASIVEKESGLAEERPRIAGVFINRLRKGMRLQSDPTVVYGITGGTGPLGRALTRADLKQPTPYNTYTNRGLPPGPICNPGRDAIAAVLAPEKTDALYFVADGTGGHVFAKTLAEHNRNVAKWRKIQRKRR